MSEVRLNLIDSHTVLCGTIHGSVVDSCIAALSAEPEIIGELAAALGRYVNAGDESTPFGGFYPRSHIDERPYDAGIVIIDLAARIVAAESTYSNPQPEGTVHYHNGHHATDISIPYRVPPDWLFVNSTEAHRWSRERRLKERPAPVDFRAILYGRPLLEFVVSEVMRTQISNPETSDPQISNPEAPRSQISDPEILRSQPEILPTEPRNPLTHLHAIWLTTPRHDLQNTSPRDVMLEKQDFIDFDLHSRSIQWSLLNEGPPCIAPDAFAYRFAGFGTHEWVIYYDLVRHLLKTAVELEFQNEQQGVVKLEEVKTLWLETGNADYDGRTPAVIIDNERRRLPEAMSPEQMIIDEDCDCCRMMAQEAAMGFGPAFWHLDGSQMEEEFAFSFCKTIAEWELENQRREESYREFEFHWAERENARRSRQREWDEEQLRLAMGEMEDEDVTLDLPHYR